LVLLFLVIIVLWLAFSQPLHLQLIGDRLVVLSLKAASSSIFDQVGWLKLYQMSVIEIILHIDTISKEELNAEAWLAEPRSNRTGLNSEHPGHVVDVVVVWEFLVDIVIEVLRVKSALCKWSGSRGDVAAYAYSSDLVN